MNICAQHQSNRRKEINKLHNSKFYRQFYLTDFEDSIIFVSFIFLSFATVIDTKNINNTYCFHIDHWNYSIDFLFWFSNLSYCFFLSGQFVLLIFFFPVNCPIDFVWSWSMVLSCFWAIWGTAVIVYLCRFPNYCWSV